MGTKVLKKGMNKSNEQELRVVKNKGCKQKLIKKSGEQKVWAKVLNKSCELRIWTKSCEQKLWTGVVNKRCESESC